MRNGNAAKLLRLFEKVLLPAKSVERYGIRKTIENIIKKNKPLSLLHVKIKYLLWIKKNEPSKADLKLQKRFSFSYRPKISIVIPLCNTSPCHFRELLVSVQAQTYDNWELCLADVGPEKNENIDTLCSGDKRIRSLFLNENKGISANTNEAIKLASGDYMAFMDQDDTIAPFALYEIVKYINGQPDVEFIYSDEDRLVHGKRSNPIFKPDFAPDSLRSHNYMAHFIIVKKGLLERLGGLRSGYDGAQDYDLVLRITEMTSEIRHIRKILYHRRGQSDHLGKLPYSALEAGRKALDAHIDRLGLTGKAYINKKDTGYFNIIYDVTGNPFVSIVIPNKDYMTTLKTCVDSILGRSTYSNYEIVIVENNSENEETFGYYRELENNTKIRVLHYPEKGFNYSKLINFGVRNCRSDYIVQLNNDTEVITPNWLELMLGLAQRPDVGAVGAKLLYPDGNIQQAGVYLEKSGWFMIIKHNICGIQNYIALTVACVMSRREVYEKINYMDEQFKVSHGDVDFCLSLRKIGLYTVFTPLVELKHYEGKTRGYDTTPEKKNLQHFEWISLCRKWSKFIQAGDPYVNSGWVG